MKVMSLILKIFAGLLAAIILAVGIISVTVDPNDYHDEITTLVKKETGRDLTIKNMSLSFFPHLGINLESASLSNAKGFSQHPFIQVDKVQLGAAILPLLSQKLQVDTLTLHGLSLNLERNKEGVSNWDDLVQPSDKADNDTPEEKSTESNENPLNKLASLNFGGIDVQNGNIHWKDEKNQQNIDLTKVNFSSGSITLGTFFQLDFSANATINSPQISTDLNINLEAKLDKDGQYAIRNVHIQNTATGQGIPVDKAVSRIELAALTIEQNQLTLPELNIHYDVHGGQSFPLSSLKGQLTFNNVTANLDTQAFQANEIVLNANATGDTLPNGKANLRLKTSAQLDLIKQTATLPKFTLTLLDLVANGDISASNITSDAIIHTNLNLTETNLRTWMKQANITLPEMSDTNTLTKVGASLSAQFNSKNQAVKINNLKLALDDSLLTGKAAISQFDAPQISYNLALNKINLNRYLPTKKAQPVASKTEDNSDTKIELPIDLLRKLTIDGTLKVGQLTFDKLKPSKIVMTIKGTKGNLAINPLQANIFKTQVFLNAGLDVRGKAPKYRVKTHTNNLPIGDVLIALADTDKLSGTGTLKANIVTSGERISEFKKNLNGTAFVNLSDGAVKGFNLAQAIRDAKAKISGQPVSPSDPNAKTDFSSLIADVTIVNGIINTNTLSAQAPFMRINGSGKVNIPNETLNYLVKTKIVASDKGQGGAELQDLNGLTLPVKLKGSLTSPNISLDLASLLEQKTKAKIEQKKEEVVKEVQKNVEEKLKDTLLKGFKF